MFPRDLGVAEGLKEDKASRSNFLRSLKDRGLAGVKPFTSDRCLGQVEPLTDSYPDALWQRCVVHFYRNVFSLVPSGKVREVATKLEAMRLGKAADLVRGGAVVPRLPERALETHPHQQPDGAIHARDQAQN